MLNTGLSPWPSFSEEEIAAVSEVLASNRVNYWTGDVTRAFEKEFAEWCEVNYAVAATNGTLALELALRAIGVGPGDEVIVTPRTFIASVSTVINVGATPVFADIDLNSQNISAATIEPLVSKRTKAIIPVHLGGMPCDMDPIMDLAKRHNLKVIEDCAQAHGALYKGRPVGSIGHIGAWSFCQDKIMTTGGEGGMVTTNDRQYWLNMWSYKDHGKSWHAVHERDHPPGYRWLHESFGSNFRMLEMQAAIGRIQLGKMSGWTKRRNTIADQLSAVCKRHGAVRVPLVGPDKRHAYYRFYAFVQPEKLAAGWSRDRILREIRKMGIPCLEGSASEVYLETAFDGTNLRPATRLPNAKELGETGMAFLTHPNLTDAEVVHMSSVIDQVMGAASIC